MWVALSRSMDIRGKQFGFWVAGLGALAMATLSGCANFGKGYMARRSLSGQIFSSTLGAGGLYLNQVPAEVASAYDCSTPLRDNVSIQRSEVATSRNTFIACPSKVNTTDIALIAQTTDFDVCVFPVQEISETAIFLKSDLSTNLPLRKCGRLTRSASQVTNVVGAFSFPATNYNAVIVSKREDEERMLKCLTNPQSPSQGMQTCAEFSYGAFRANQN